MKKAVCWMMVFVMLFVAGGCGAENAAGTTGPTGDALQAIPETSFPGTEPPETTGPAVTLAPETFPPETTSPEATDAPATVPPATEPPETTAPPATEAPTEPPATEPKPTEPTPVSSGKVSFTEVSEVVNTTGYVNVRSGPGSSYKKVVNLPTNYSLLRTGVGDNGWSRVIFDDEEAYVATSYLERIEACEYSPYELLEMYPLEQCGCEKPVATRCWYNPAGCLGPASWVLKCECGFRSYLSVPGSEPTGHPFADGFCTKCGAPDPNHPEGAKYLAERDMTNYVAIGQAATKYINQYRLAEGSTELIWLPGLSEVAQYRTTLLPHGHDTAAEREALEHFQYGRYVELSDGSGYWTFDGGEAYAYNVSGATIDEVGKAIADVFHRSPGHWAYVGSSKYSYIGIGFSTPDTYLWVGTVNYG